MNLSLLNVLNLISSSFAKVNTVRPVRLLSVVNCNTLIYELRSVLMLFVLELLLRSSTHWIPTTVTREPGTTLLTK